MVHPISMLHHKWSVSATSSLPTIYSFHTHHYPQISLSILHNSMASHLCNAYAGLSFGAASKPRRRMVAVRAESINPSIRKTDEKVVDSVLVTELAKPVTAYCRCWRSGTFPLCDGTHLKHNKATGDNVGPLLLKTK